MLSTMWRWKSVIQGLHVAALNETVIRGMGELHLREIISGIEKQQEVQVETDFPAIEYKETITVPAEGHNRHKKQTGGAGQFGEVYLRIDPLDRGGGFEFVDKVVGGVILGNSYPQWKRESSRSWTLARSPVTNCRT